MDAEVLGDEVVWAAEVVGDTHEGKVRDVLHGSEDEGWPMCWKECVHHALGCIISSGDGKCRRADACRITFLMNK